MRRKLSGNPYNYVFLGGVNISAMDFSFVNSLASSPTGVPDLGNVVDRASFALSLSHALTESSHWIEMGQLSPVFWSRYLMIIVQFSLLLPGQGN
jgi:hypothetical protein